jgi:hypothetical protein
MLKLRKIVLNIKPVKNKNKPGMAMNYELGIGGRTWAKVNVGKRVRPYLKNNLKQKGL